MTGDTPQRIAEIVRNVHAETGYGPDRDELAAILGVPTPARHIPGLSSAIAAGHVRYDRDDRLVPGAAGGTP